MASEVRNIQKQVLRNGLVAITETMSHVRSVSVGVWVRNGSRREIPEENGLAHFIEHMVFKGDRKSTRLNSSHRTISYAVFCLKKKKRFRQSVYSAIVIASLMMLVLTLIT